MATEGAGGPGISDSDYRQRVRRYKPSSLLPLIAIAAIRYREQQAWLNNLKYRPWALADAARVSLAYGTEHNRTEATDRGLFQILDAYSRFDDPLLRDHDARAFMLRMADEQMPWQADDFRAPARTAAIFSQPASRETATQPQGPRRSGRRPGVVAVDRRSQVRR